MAAQYNYSGKQILIVDDQRAFQVMLKAMLQNFGANDVFFANTGEAAVRACRKRKFDILLVDYNLGTGKNGGQLLEELRVSQLLEVDALFFIISGDNNKSMVLSALEMEPDEFITKPFSQFQLHNRLARAHVKRQSLREVFQALAKKDYTKVIELCDQQIEAESRYTNYCRNMRVEAQIALGEFEAAKVALETILEERKQTWAKATLGRVHLLLKDNKSAINTLSRSVTESPLLLTGYDWLARAYRAEGETDKALETVLKASKLAVNSIERQQLLAELAMEAGDLTLAKETFSTILQLARRSIHRGPHHLCNYVRSLIDEAQNEDDLYRKNRLLQEVNSVLFHARREEGKDEDFNFDAFEGISQARVHATKGEMNKAKRLLFDSHEGLLEEPSKVSGELLPDTFLTLNSVGEFEYAMPFAEELEKRADIDPISLSSAQKVLRAEDFELKLGQFREYNKMGIEAYEESRYIEATNFFDKALQVAPGNTGAILNKIQAILKQLNQSQKGISGQLLTDCKTTIKLLDGLKLNDNHAERYSTLKSEFQQLGSKNK
ncbi:MULTISPECIES: tetratricopeptide repeat-containing response regulator [unclassified Agarivorans]|uniref:tetratricopeptide repeat-containing response regulator n=1 Tax=unclassified Agarivorans TaxID=2636026 RepID=UPI0026E47D8C|nr:MULTISPECIES: tetratricopeptide repeat-containing response regulator [unclassified Agarivorans]MDO6687174.1 response regulator [Agarivorans sp. 3_MG-2023]MDO6716899.1 response regulator [Agarivorans sp. 2_MG-2023]MDO6765606.1 response regulator [Agarivorans sp. 1_MG-2023]